MATPKLTALVMAGGRLEGVDERAAGTPIKALAEIGGESMLAKVLSALTAADSVGRIMVVGPEEVRTIAHEGAAEWALEAGGLLENVQAGIRESGLTGAKRILLIGADMAVPRAQSIDDFIVRVPAHASVSAPLVQRSAYERAYPAGSNTFVALKDGEFTMGSQIVAPASLLLYPPAAIAPMLGSRKSQLQMARALGLGFVFALMTHSLTVAKIEQRASDLLGARACAVPNCAPDLAFDIDNAADLAYARDLFARNLDGT